MKLQNNPNEEENQNLATMMTLKREERNGFVVV